MNVLPCQALSKADGMAVPRAPAAHRLALWNLPYAFGSRAWIFLVGAVPDMRLRGVRALLRRWLLHDLVRLRLALIMHIDKAPGYAIKREGLFYADGGKTWLHGYMDAFTWS